MSSANEKVYAVNGMHCAACAVNVEKALCEVPGVEQVYVNIANHTATLVGQDLPGDTILVEAVHKAGYDLLSTTGESSADREVSHNLTPLISAVVFTLPLFVLSMFPIEFSGKETILALLATPVVIYSGAGFFRRAFRMLMRGQAGMDTLVALGSGTAYLFSLTTLLFPQTLHLLQMGHVQYFETAGVIITLILLGKHLEHRATSRAGDSLRNLVQGQPKEVVILDNGEQRNVSLSTVKPGDLILVKPGQIFPVDGTVRKGSAFVREEMLTGESEPRSLGIGDSVISGSLNLDGILQIETKQAGKDRLIEQIAELVSRAQARKSAIQQFADRISGWFVALVLGIAVLTAVIWILTGGDNAASFAFYTSLSVLVIACPCALGLATPTAMMVGLGRAARSGIVVKDGTQFQLAGKCTDIVFDKTGTLTESLPGVNSIVYHVETHEQETFCKNLLFTLEGYSSHPLAQAILNYLGHAEELEPDFFREVPGKGLEARINRQTYLLGNAGLLREHGIDPGSDRGTWLASDRILATIQFQDIVRKDVPGLVMELKNAGYRLHLLSGDSEEKVRSLKEKLKLDFAKGGVNPTGKLEYINKLKSEGRKVIMLGDGINDGPALAHADVGIAMGNGSDLAIEHAGISLMHGDIQKLTRLIQISRRTLKTIYQNYFWAFAYNVVAIPIAAGILYPLNGYLLNPMLAALAMAFSSISVVLNSLRMNWFR